MKDKAAIIEAAQKFAAKGQIDKSIAELEKLLKDGKDVNIYNAIGDLYLKKGAPKEAAEFFLKAASSYKEDGFALKAIALYKKILNILPSDPDVLISLAVLNAEKGLTVNAIENYIKAAEIYYRNGKPEKTLDLYEKAQSLSPSDINIQLKITELYLKMGLKEKASDCYSSVASVFLEKDDLPKAHEFYSKALEIDPQNIYALVGFSRLAEKENNLSQALEYLAQASSFAPDNKDILMNHANLSIRLNRPDDARKSLSRLVETDPSDIDAKRLLGSLYLKSNDIRNAWRELLPCIEESINVRSWDEALELLRHFRELYPIPVRERIVTVLREKKDNPMLLNELSGLAALYEGNGSHNEALQLYKEAIELDPRSTVIQDKIKRLENILNPPAPPQAEAVAEKHLENMETEPKVSLSAENMPEETVSAFSLDDESSSMSDTDIAEIFGKLEETSEEDYESHYIAGVDYKERGLFDDAINEFQIAARDTEKSLLCSRMIALCYIEKKSYPHAIEEFNRLIQKMPGQDERLLDMKYELAGAYFSNNDYTNALELYLEIQAKNPGFRDVAQKINTLNAQSQNAVEKPKPKKDRVSYI